MTLKNFLQKWRFANQNALDFPTALRFFFNNILLSFLVRIPYLKKIMINSQNASSYCFNIYGKEVKMRLRMQDLAMVDEIFIKENYQFPDEWLTDNGIIIDAGAHIGLFSIFCAIRYSNKNPFIICIEPSSKNMEILKYNIKSLNCNVAILSAALSSKNEKVFFDESAIGYNHKISHSGVSIDGVSIDKLFEIYKINNLDILKIDIEGGEQDIFDNRGEWLSKVNHIIIELHQNYSYQNFTKALENTEHKILKINTVDNLKMLSTSKM